MKKNFCIAAVCAAAMSAAFASQMGEAMDAYSEKLLDQVMQEATMAEMTDVKALTDKLIAKMRDDQAGLREAYTADCTATFGEEKKAACECVGEKTDYDKLLDSIKAMTLAEDEAAAEAAMRPFGDAAVAVHGACGISADEVNAKLN